MVVSAMPPDEMNSVPPLDASVSTAVPPLPTISLPPAKIVVALVVPVVSPFEINELSAATQDRGADRRAAAALDAADVLDTAARDHGSACRAARLHHLQAAGKDGGAAGEAIIELRAAGNLRTEIRAAAQDALGGRRSRSWC